MNIFDGKSFRVWKNLRKVTMDFGRQYFNKHLANTQANFFVGFVCILGLWITYGIDYSSETYKAKIEIKKL